MEDGGELEGTFECSGRSRQRSKEGVAVAAAAAAAAGGGGGLNRANEAGDKAVDNEAGMTRPLSVAVEEPQTRTPPRLQSPIHRQYEEPKEGVSNRGRAGATAERGGAGGAGGNIGSVASSIGRWETPPTQMAQQQQPPLQSAVVSTAATAAAPSAAAGESNNLFAYVGGSSGSGGSSSKVAARPPPSSASAAPASTSRTSTTTTTAVAAAEPGSIVKAALPSVAGGALRRIPPSGKSTSGDVSALPPPANMDSRASAPVRAPSPLRAGGLQVQSLGAEASEMFSAEAVTPTGPMDASELRGGGGLTPLSAGGGSDAERGAPEGGGGTSVAARVVTWPPASPAPAGRVWQRRTEVCA